MQRPECRRMSAAPAKKERAQLSLADQAGREAAQRRGPQKVAQKAEEPRTQNAECRTQNAECRTQNAEC